MRDWMLMVSVLAVAVWGRPLPSQAEFPSAATAATRNLEFHVGTPATGTLAAQIRSQLRELIDQRRGARLIKLRVFASPPLLVECREVIAKILAGQKLHLPVLSLVGVAGFPDSAQQVQIEATMARSVAVNPFGLGFVAGLATPAGDQTVAGLLRVTREAGITAANVTRISCFYENPDFVASARSGVRATFPNAEASFVYSYRQAQRPLIECEGVARLSERSVPDVRYFNRTTAPPSANYSQAALVSAPRLAFTGTDGAQGSDTAAMGAMFDRVRRAAATQGAVLRDAVMGDNYWLVDSARDNLRLVRAQNFGTTVPAATGVFFTGLESPSASAAVEFVIAVGRQHVDTIALFPGSALIDGRYIQPHRAVVTQIVRKAGAVLATRHFTLDKSITAVAGKPALHLLLAGIAGEPNSAVRGDILLDLRTMMLIRREDRDSAGVVAQLVFDGAGVRGARRDSSGLVPFDITLPAPVFSSVFLDAVANASRLRPGTVLHIPAFDAVSGRGEVHHLHVVGRDTVRVQDKLENAWLLEEPAGGANSPLRIWLTRKPPYFPLEIVYRPDGSVVRTEQRIGALN